MDVIDILNKEFSEIISLVGYGRFLRGLLKTITEPTFVKELSTEKLKAYITLAGFNENQEESSICKFLENLYPESYHIYASGTVYNIYKALRSLEDEMIRKLVQRSAL